jgi:hypothetical protein
MRYFIGFIAIVTLVIVAFVLVLKGFGGNKSSQNQIDLLDYANSQTVVSLEMDGAVVADQNHRGYRITVGRDANTIEVTKGYGKEVIRAQTYPNNSEAYADFLRALQLQNFTKGIDDSDREDMRGFCPSGSRFVFTIQNASQNVRRYWTSTCGGGTFRGNTATIRQLFSRQIPDFAKLTSDTRL